MSKFKKYFVCLSFLSLTIFSQSDITPLISKQLIGGDGKSICRELAISPNENTAAAIYGERGLYVWSLNDGGKYSQRHLFHTRKTNIEQSRLSHNGKIDVDDNQNVLIGVKNEIWLLEPDYLENSHGEKFLIGNTEMCETKIGEIKGNIQIIDIKFARGNRFEAIVVYEYSLQKGVHIERWDLNERKMLVSATGASGVSGIGLSKDGKQFVTSVYHTNDLARNNYSSLRNYETLEEISRIQHSAPSSFVAVFSDNSETYGFLQKIVNNFSLSTGEIIELEIEPLAVSFFKDTNLVLSAAGNQTIQIINPNEAEGKQAWIWPFHENNHFPQYQFSSSGKKLLTWNDDSGLQLWELNDDHEDYESVVASSAYRNLPKPERANRNGTEIDLTCEIKDGQITISNNNNKDYNSFGTIFWRVYDKEGELVDSGRFNDNLSRGEAITISPKENIDNNKHMCDASFYTSYRNVP